MIRLNEQGADLMTKFIDILTVIIIFLSVCFCMYCVAFMLGIV